MLRIMIRTAVLALITAVGALAAWAPAAHAATDTHAVSGTPATSEPSTPGMPTASGVTTTLASLVWAPSTDSVGVTGYTVQVLKNGTWSDYTTATINVATVTRLAADTSYTFAVIAHDAPGSNSPRSQPVTFTTLPYGTGLTCSVFIQPFNNGFTMTASILNMAPTTSNGWKLAFSLPASTTVNSVFTGVMSRTGDQATIVNASYSGNIAPGYTIYTGFTASFTGPFTPPSGFVLNGSPCTVTANH